MVFSLKFSMNFYEFFQMVLVSCTNRKTCRPNLPFLVNHVGIYLGCPLPILYFQLSSKIAHLFLIQIFSSLLPDFG